MFWMNSKISLFVIGYKMSRKKDQQMIRKEYK